MRGLSFAVHLQELCQLMVHVLLVYRAPAYILAQATLQHYLHSWYPVGAIKLNRKCANIGHVTAAFSVVEIHTTYLVPVNYIDVFKFFEIFHT